MGYDPERHHRHSIRLTNYDYALNGAYFVTLCAQDPSNIFGDVVDGVMHANDPGRMVEAIWAELPLFYAGVAVDQFVLMPNHIHGIVLLVGRTTPAAGLSLGDLVQRFKTMTTRRYIDGVKQSGWRPFPGRLWQRN